MDEQITAPCEGKEALSFRRANEVAKAMRRRGRKVASYRCECCRTFHVGNPTWCRRSKKRGRK